MDRNYLLEKANGLKQVSITTADEYHQKAEMLTAKMNAMMLERPDIDGLVGANNLSMMRDNHANHVGFIASILKYGNPDVLTDTILWVFRAYRSHGFTTNYWAAQLNGWIDILNEVLSKESFVEVYPYYEWMQINIPIFVKVSDEKLEATDSLH
jgi:hypothetical protein